LCIVLLHLKECYALLGTIDSEVGESAYSFKLLLDGSKAVEVSIFPDVGKAEADMATEVRDDLFNKLENIDLSRSSPKVIEELDALMAPLEVATRLVLRDMKYSLQCIKLEDALLSTSGRYYSIDRMSWLSWPNRSLPTIRGYKSIQLDKQNARTIQEHLSTKYEPFVALRHLHAAMNETSPRFKWIDATIAAEIAIKEFLIRKEPILEVLLLEIQSPPLHKLYGPILRRYAGEESPKKKEIQKGAERRNELVHRPEENKIDEQEAAKYVEDVQVAIFHLLSLLYPDDPIIKQFNIRK